MGTTDTQLQTGGGQFGFVLAIEGFAYLITDAADTSKVTTAWSGSGWTQAVAGLRVLGGIKQSIEPFKSDLDVPSMRFEVMDVDGSDIVGKALWKSKPSIVSRLSATYTPAANGSGTMTVYDNTSFSAGTYYVGSQAITVASKTGGTTLNIGAAGTNILAPFTADASNTYSWPQSVTTPQNGRVSLPTKVTDVPQSWIGKNVALYMHRIVAGVWDTRAQAHLEFAGKVEHIEDAPGMTAITCSDLRKDVSESVILRNQWRGFVQEGIFLTAGDWFRAGEIVRNAGSTNMVRTYSANNFTVVTSGASGADEINEGWYDLDDLYSKLSNWLSGDANLTAKWSIKREAREGSWRTVIQAIFSSETSAYITFDSSSVHAYRFFGFLTQVYNAQEGRGYYYTSEEVHDTKHKIVSNEPPYRVQIFQGSNTSEDSAYDGFRIRFSGSEGVLADLTDYMGATIGGFQDDGNQWAVFKIKSGVLFGRVESETDFRGVRYVPATINQLNKEDHIKDLVITYDDPDEYLAADQVALISGKFSEIVPKLIASINGDGVNHATYDAFPWGAAIPWSLLGDNFVNSCKSIESSLVSDGMSLYVHRPTRLWDILGPEFALRFAFFVFKDGGYRFVSPAPPNALTAAYTLTEANKAAPSGDPVQPSHSEMTSEYVVNVVKINYNRQADNDYASHLVVEDADAIYLTKGKSRTVTIDAVNSYNTETSPEFLASQIVSRIFPMFGRPIKLIRRAISPDVYGIAPGDAASVSDDLVRDPATGARGISARGAVCISSFHDYGHEGGKMYGEVTLLITDEDRTYPLSPAAEIDTTYSTGGYTNGYDSAAFRFKLKQHAYSRTDDPRDVVHFDADDTITVVEFDPAAPASAQTWNRTIASTDDANDTVTLTAAISTPAWDGTATKRYVIIAQPYTSTQASQKLHTFQASGTADSIQGAIEPNLYADFDDVTSFTAGTGAVNPSLIAHHVYGDGDPVTPFHIRSLAAMANNLAQYKTAVHIPFMADTAFECTSSSYQMVHVFPVYMGTWVKSGRTRKINLAPFFRISTAGTATMRATTSASPPTGTSLTSLQYAGKTYSTTWATTSTTYAVATAGTLDPVIDQQMYTWVTIEGKTTAGSLYWRGFSILYSGAET